MASFYSLFIPLFVSLLFFIPHPLPKTNKIIFFLKKQLKIVPPLFEGRTACPRLRESTARGGGDVSLFP